MWVIAAGLAISRMPWPFVGAAVLVSINPIIGVLTLIAVSVGLRVRHRRVSDTVSEAQWLRRVAGDVGAGATLRNAIGRSVNDIAEPHVSTMCAAGVPMAEIGAEVATSLPVSGNRFAALCAMSELTGASIDTALRGCAEAAEEADRRIRRQRTATTQVRLSAWVVGLAPLVLTGLIFALRGIPEPGGALVITPMVVGVLLQVVGLLIVFRISGRVVP